MWCRWPPAISITTAWPTCACSPNPRRCCSTTPRASSYGGRRSLPTGRFEAAVWLDFDHDYDNDLFLFGEKSVLLRNEGEAGFHDYSAQFPFVAGRALDAVALRVIPDTKGIDIAVSYTDRPGVLYRDQLSGVFQAVPCRPWPAGARPSECPTSTTTAGSTWRSPRR